MRVKLAVFLTFIILTSGAVYADTIVLKNSKTLKGKIIEQKNGVLKVDTGGDIYNFFDYEIKKILPDSKENDFFPVENNADKPVEALKEPLAKNSKDQNLSVEETKEENVNNHDEE